MFNKGEYVVYSNNGICRVEDTIMMDMQDGQKEYYLLLPVNEPTAKIYLPLDYVGPRVRPAMNGEQAQELINKLAEIAEPVVQNEKERERIYKEAMASNDPYKLVGVLKAICRRKKERELLGRKTTSVDDRYFKLVETLLCGELMHALGVGKEEAERMLCV